MGREEGLRGDSAFINQAQLKRVLCQWSSLNHKLRIVSEWVQHISLLPLPSPFLSSRPRTKLSLCRGLGDGSVVIWSKKKKNPNPRKERSGKGGTQQGEEV